uniref:Uncharacterized protein n=1 Tax=Ditylenchus dipsaci TaxID=166011 RepID=A0A915D203_9BILA
MLKLFVLFMLICVIVNDAGPPPPCMGVQVCSDDDHCKQKIDHRSTCFGGCCTANLKECTQDKDCEFGNKCFPEGCHPETCHVDRDCSSLLNSFLFPAICPQSTYLQ